MVQGHFPARVVVLLVLLCVGISACSGAKPAPRGIGKIFPHHLQVRRPAGPGADPHAVPGDADYTSRPLPDAKLDCAGVATLFTKLDHAALRACLGSIRETRFVRYRLHPEAEPWLELLDTEDAPACLAATLPRIPVPREMIFMARPDQRMECFATRLDLEAGLVFGVRMPWKKWNLRVDFPLVPPPADHAALDRWLGAAALTPLFSGDRGELPSRRLSDALCRQCLGEEAFNQGLRDEGEWP